MVAALLAGAAGCGGGDDGNADTTGSGGAGSGASGTGASGTGAGGPGATPTYYENVAPILYQNCVSCHVEGGVGPFALIDYQSAVTAAGAIRAATASRTMPPFHIDNSGSCNTYRDARWLSDADIATIDAWVAGGTPEGDPANAPALPGPTPGLDRVDTTVTMATDYTPNAAQSDDYRCFLVDPALAADRYLTGYEVKPGEPRVVHHVVLFVPSDEAAEAQADALDQGEAGPGYTCFGDARVPASIVVGWAPGMPATRYPDTTGFTLPAGRRVVMQVHYNLAAGPLPDRTSVDLRLDSAVDRPAYIYPIYNTNISLPPGQSSVEISREFTNQAPVPITVWGVFPHMHQIGRTLRIEAGPSGSASCLANVPDWNFYWQQFFMYEAPLTLDPGATMRITCSYDTTSRNTTTTWGEGSEDEMCGAGLYVTQ